MKILLFFLFFTLSSLFPVFITAANITKTILVPVDEYPDLSIENLYVSPQPGDVPLVAFYGEDERRIFIFDTAEKKISIFTFSVTASTMDSTPVSFVTFCWDQEDYGEFVAVFSARGRRLVFTGSIRGPKQLGKPREIGVNTIGFNYREQTLYYVDLDKEGGKALVPGGGLFSSSSWVKPRDPNLVIADFKLMTGNEPYFTLRNVKTNDNGIYKGKGFQRVVDEPGIDELYPHYSADGEMLGYIKRNKKTASARVCLHIKGKKTVLSTFTFALEENALLREYQRMYFMGKELYYFNKEPDLNSKAMKYGFFKLSESGQQDLLYRNEIISDNETVLDLLTGKQALCLEVRNFPTIRSIIPFQYQKQLYFVILTNPGKYKIQMKNPAGQYDYPGVKSQVIVIVDSRFAREEQ